MMKTILDEILAESELDEILELAAARGLRLWHRSPAAYRSYVRTGQSSGFDEAWRAVPERHRSAVDQQIQQLGLIGRGSQQRESEFGEEIWTQSWDAMVEPPDQEVTTIKLSNSVGYGGTNKKVDVEKVQKLLNKFISAGQLSRKNTLVVNGQSTTETVKTIKNFQTLFSTITKSDGTILKADGRVDAVGRTLDALNDPREAALMRLKGGNRRHEQRAHQYGKPSLSLLNGLVNGQKPFAIVWGCIDSRVPPELIFDQQLGSLFVIRTAGQAVDAVSEASAKFSIDSINGIGLATLLVVLGHTNCGAVKATCDVRVNHKTPSVITSKIREAIMELNLSNYSTPQAKFAACTRLGVEPNVKRQVKHLKDLFRDDINKDRLKIVGAIYHLHSRKVEFLP